MKFLVTGGAGYIGSNMSRMLVREGHDVVVLDTLEYGHTSALPVNATFVKGDVGDKEIVSDIFAGHAIDGVLHFAGYISVEESTKNPIRYMQNNLIAPTVLLECMKDAGSPPIIFSSTAAVYGMPEMVPIPETHPINPLSTYGLSKWNFEQLLAVYEKLAGIRSVTLRYFNACGGAMDGSNGESHVPETHLIPLACQTALGKRKEFYIYGTDYDTPDGTAVRDYIHIEDLCNAHLKVMDALVHGHKSDVYNVGTGIGASVSEVVSLVKKISGKDFTVVEKERRSGDSPELVADPTKLMKEFGWKPTHSALSEIIESAWKYHETHPNGYAETV
jgi:UDP-glucose 4-epimerase